MIHRGKNMSDKNNTKVLINGTVYTLSGKESEEYIQKVALYINNKMDELKKSDNGQLLNTRLLNVLLALNIADDLFKERDENAAHSEILSVKDDEIANLKNQIEDLTADKASLSDQIKSLASDVESYKKELDEYIEVFEQNQ